MVEAENSAIQLAELFRSNGRLPLPIVEKVARKLLPEPVKEFIRTVGKERPNYPQEDSYVASVAGYSARFWIRNYLDWFTIVKTEFASRYAQDLITTIAEMKGVVVDIGAAQGFYSILAAQAGARQVFAIDPDHNSLQSITENTNLNPETKDKVQILAYAVGDRDGLTQLHVNKKRRYASSLVPGGEGLKDTIDVEIRTLDSLISDGIVEKPDIVIIDVEGGEGNVIVGMHETLSSKNRPTDVFIELHQSLRRLGTTPENIASQIMSCGYRIIDTPIRRGGQFLCHFVTAEKQP